jgi:hypothetical protein
MSVEDTSPEPPVDAGVGDGSDDGATEGVEVGVGCVVGGLDTSPSK